jgi:hypothetical protein
MLTTQSRETSWRQGMVLDQQTAIDLNLISADESQQAIAIVISHDCDIASSQTTEPMVELIIGRSIDKLGTDSYGKTARRLHIEFQTESALRAFELKATEKIECSKEVLLSTLPCTDLSLNRENIVTLQRWLAARYHRAAFANEFERRLKLKPAHLDKKITKAVSDPSEYILAVFFDVDDSIEINQTNLNDTYQLVIILLYDGSKDEAHVATQKAADAIQTAFENAFKKDEKWENIQLVDCMPISDSVMTVAHSRLLRQWRLDYMSQGENPHQEMID